MRNLCFGLVVAAIFILNSAYAEPKGDFFVGSSAFMLITAIDESNENPEFYQLNIGVRLTGKDSLSLEAIRWRYYGTLGSNQEEKFPGSVRSEGFALAYQRFIFENIYTALHALFLQQTFLDEDEKKIGEGHQLFCTFRLGYHFGIGDTFFIEPSFAMTYWPIDEGLPDSFQEKEDDHPNYAFEPGLHIGVNF